MKSWGIIIVTALGFLMGLVLAGVGVTSAKTYFSSSAPVGEKTIDQYWHDAGVSSKELNQLISNTKCQSSEKYFLACVNSLISVLPKYRLALSSESGQVIKGAKASVYDGKGEKENLAPFVKMYERLQNRQIDFDAAWKQVLAAEKSDSMKSHLVGIGINSFLSVYKDPHTYILPSRFYEDVGSKFERSHLFVGVSFEKRNTGIFVRKVHKNSDAEIAGLKVQDQLISFNGISATELNLADISLALRDPAQKSFQLSVRRLDGRNTINIVRTYKKLNYLSIEKHSGLRDYSVISLSKFNHGACEQISKKIKELSEESVSGIVLDLRDNPGGELNEVACIAGLFVGINKKIYSVKYFEPLKTDEVVLTSGSLLFTGPLVVLTNSSSASASELLAGALQEYNRAVIVGERTFGKGTFQESEIWNKNANISLFRTQGFYLLPSGASPQLKGITPDFTQNGPVTQMREENMYLNPVAAFQDFPVQTVANLKQQQFASEFEKCLPDSMFSIEDAILRKGLEVLSCHRISSLMATQFSADEFN